MQKLLKYATVFIIITTFGVLYDKFKSKYLPDEELANIDLVNQHLLGEDGYNIKRPILWVYTDQDVNSIRNIRKTERENVYIKCCLNTIIDKCGQSFNICLIDDSSFKKLIPGWDINIEDLASPLKENIRRLATTKLLYKYGGMVIPDSTIVLNDLVDVYEKGNKMNGFFVANVRLNCDIQQRKSCYPNKNCMGCVKNNKEIKEFIRFLELMNSKDYTDESNFNNEIEKYLSNKINFKKITSICSSYFGTKDINKKTITIDDLMSDKLIKYPPCISCVIIPKEDLLKRRQYGWFLNLSIQEILDSNTALGKLLSMCQNH